MSSIQIPNLPAAIALNGSEQVEVVQAGVSCRTTTQAISDLQVVPCASYYSTATQNHGGIGNTGVLSCNQTDFQYGITLVSANQFTVAAAGIYNIQFSLQLVSAINNKHAYVWLKKNGGDVSWSNTEVDLPNKDYGYVAAWNFLVTMAAGEYLQIAWTSDDAVSIKASDPAPYGPAIPSAIVTMNLVRRS